MKAVAFRPRGDFAEGGRRGLAGRAVAIGDAQIRNLDLRNAGQRQTAAPGRRGGRRLAEFPVAAAAAIGLEIDIGARQRDLAQIDIAGQERQQRQLQRQAVGGQHLRPRGPVGIAEADLFGHDRRHQRIADMDTAVDRQRAAGRVLRRCLDLRRETAEIDKGQRIERAGQQQHDDNDEAQQFPHGTCLP